MKNTKTIAKVAVLAALGIILYLLEVAILPWAPFLKLDVSNVPTLLAAFGVSPIAAVAIEAIKGLFYLPMSKTGGIGELANFILGSMFAISAAIVYKRQHSKKGAVIALLCGSVIVIISAMLINYFITLPLYAPGMTNDVKINTILTAILPFNVIKCTVISVITLLIYKRISLLLHK